MLQFLALPWALKFLWAPVVGDALCYAWAVSLGTVLLALGCVVLVAWLDRHPTHEWVAQAWC